MLDRSAIGQRITTTQGAWDLVVVGGGAPRLRGARLPVTRRRLGWRTRWGGTADPMRSTMSDVQTQAAQPQQPVGYIAAGRLHRLRTLNRLRTLKRYAYHPALTCLLDNMHKAFHPLQPEARKF